MFTSNESALSSSRALTSAFPAASQAARARGHSGTAGEAQPPTTTCSSTPPAQLRRPRVARLQGARWRARTTTTKRKTMSTTAKAKSWRWRRTQHRNPRKVGELQHAARGGSGQPLILVHGCDWRSWQPVLAALEAAHDVVAIDLPGFAEPAAADRAAATPARLADAVEAELDRLAGHAGRWSAIRSAVGSRWSSARRGRAAPRCCHLAVGLEFASRTRLDHRPQRADAAPRARRRAAGAMADRASAGSRHALRRPAGASLRALAGRGRRRPARLWVFAGLSVRAQLDCRYPHRCGSARSRCRCTSPPGCSI